MLWQLVVPAAIGVLTGACVAGVSYLAEHVALGQLGRLPGYWPAAVSALALPLTWLATRFVTRATAPATSELYIKTYHTPGGRLPLRQVPGRLLAAAATVGLGGSQGFESPSALIGATWSQVLARWQASEVERRGLLAAGASAGIAAVFSSPAVGALYGIEVPFRRDVDAPRLAPCAIGAVCAYLVRDALIGSRHLVPLVGLPQIDGTFMLAALCVAVACGLGARAFAVVEDLLRRLGRSQERWQRACIGGVALAALAAVGYHLAGAWITFGPGYIAAAWLTSTHQPIGLIGAVLAVRAAGNLICVYGAGGGGVFTSLACNGAFLGQMVAQAFGRGETHQLALLGAACFLANGYRLPLACMLYVGEQSGSVAISIAALAAIALGQLLMGEESVSEAQVEQRT